MTTQSRGFFLIDRNVLKRNKRDRDSLLESFHASRKFKTILYTRHFMKDQIEKRIVLKAPVLKVWNALTDYRQFGEWFCVKVKKPFEQGQIAQGELNYPGYEQMAWEIAVQKIEPDQLFSFTWHPYAIDTKRDYSNEIPTLVTFKLKKMSEGTELSVIESGFNQLPDDRRLEAFQMNEEGWTEQMNNIKRYVESP